MWRLSGVQETTTPQTRSLSFFQEYWVDAWQRSILTLDALRERGNTYFEQAARNAPHVLSFAFEPVRDGRLRPVSTIRVHSLMSPIQRCSCCQRQVEVRGYFIEQP